MLRNNVREAAFLPPKRSRSEREPVSVFQKNAREGKTAPMGGGDFATPEAIAFLGLFQRIEDARTG